MTTPSEPPAPVTSYLAERYLPAATREVLDVLVDRDRSAADVMSIRHVQTIYVPEDETCFTLFEAQSAELIAAASERFALGYRRVVPAIALQSPDPSVRRDGDQDPC
jgi:hypothetical protein